MRKREEAMPYKVLVVDDEKQILEEAAEALADEGYECFVADSVDRALEILRREAGITLVVTDLKMPGRTGSDLIKAAQQEFDREITFVIMSGHGSPTVKTNGINIDDYTFLRKPLDINEFLDVIGHVVSTDKAASSSPE